MQVTVHHAAAQRLLADASEAGARLEKEGGTRLSASPLLRAAAVHAILDLAMAVREVEAELRHRGNQ